MLVGTFHIHAVYKRAKTDKARRAKADSPSMVKSGMPPCSSAQLAMLVAAALNMQCCESQRLSLADGSCALMKTQQINLQDMHYL